MIWKSFEFNGQTISKTTWDFRVGIDVIQWKSLDISDEQTNVQWFHGVKLSPTFARGRRISIEGMIIADDQIWSSKGIDYLEWLFALQWVPNQVELLPFIVTDEQDRRWQINAKIKEPLSIDINDNDWQAWATRRFRVVLQSEDPRYYNVDQKEVQWSEWFYGWVKLWAKLWFKMDDNFNEIQIITWGNIDAPLEITLTVKWEINTLLMIKNLTDGTFFALDIDAVVDDIIVINSNTFEVTKNGINIKSSRVAWSTWPKAKFSTTFSIYDDDGWLVESDFDIDIKYRDVLL